MKHKTVVEYGFNSIAIKHPSDAKINALEEVLSYFDGDLHVRKFYSYMEEDGIIYLPAMFRKQVEFIFADAEFVMNPNIIHYEDIEIEAKFPPRNQTQEDGIDFLTHNEPFNNNRSLILPTGTGKTFMSIEAICRLKRKTMILVDTVSLADQWIDELEILTTLERKDMIVLVSSDIKEYLDGPMTESVVIFVHRSLANFSLVELYDLFATLKIGLRIFDEYHVEYKSMIRILSSSDTSFNFFLSATPDRSDYMENKIFKMFREGISIFTRKRVVNHVDLILYEYDQKIEPKVVRRFQISKGFSTMRYANYIAEHEYMFEIYFNMIKVLLELYWGKKIVFTIPNNKLISMVGERLSVLIHDEDYEKIGIFNSTIHKNKRAEQLLKPIILTTDKSFEKSLNVLDMEVLVNLVPFKSQPKSTQLIGRIRDVGSGNVFIDVGDISIPKEHTRRRTTLKKEARKVYRTSHEKMVEHLGR